MRQDEFGVEWKFKPKEKEQVLGQQIGEMRLLGSLG